MGSTLSDISEKGGESLKVNITSKGEFIKGVQEFEEHEKRDAIYKVATLLVSPFWGIPYDMANGLGVLLLTTKLLKKASREDFKDVIVNLIEENLRDLPDVNLKKLGARNRPISKLRG